MNKSISTLILATLTILTAPLYAAKHGGHSHHGGHHGYHGHGYGSSGAWIAPTVLGTALTTAAIGAATSKPQTIVVQQSDHENLKNTVKNLQRDNKQLKKKIKQLERKLARLQPKEAVAA